MDTPGLSAFIFCAAFLIFMGYIYQWNWRNEHKWHSHHHFGRVTFIDGTRSGIFGEVMRRRISGRWEYRPLTAEEEKDAKLDSY